MHAGAQDLVGLGDVGIGELGEREFGLHVARPPRQPAAVEDDLRDRSCCARVRSGRPARRAADGTHRRRAGPSRTPGSASRDRRRPRRADAPVPPARPASAAAPPRSGRRPSRRSRRRRSRAPAPGRARRRRPADRRSATPATRRARRPRQRVLTSRIALQIAAEAASCSISTAPNAASVLPSELARSATEAAMPSSRSSVSARPCAPRPASPPAAGRNAEFGRCAAPDTSNGEPSAAVIARLAVDIVERRAAPACARSRASASPSASPPS